MPFEFLYSFNELKSLVVFSNQCLYLIHIYI